MSTASNGFVSLLGLNPADYEPHLLHGPERSYTETNCYTDILIEFLHARGDEPLAMMGYVLRVDFEGDQWTFFKPLPEHVERLYGVDIHEMQPYRPLPEQIAEQIARRRTIVVELDSWYLPDTAATSYRREHVKSSVVAEAIDRRWRAPALLPWTRVLRARGRGLPRHLPPRPAVLRGRAPALHRARAPRRGGLAHGSCAAGGGTRAARREPRTAATAESFRTLRRAAHGRSAAPARGRSRGLPRLCVCDRPHGRLRVRGRAARI